MSLNSRAAVLDKIGTPFAIEQVQGLRGSAFASPVLTAIALVAIMVLATETDFKSYFAGAQFINVLLSPATTALAIPLARNARLIRENLHSISLALLAGSITSIVSGIGWVARRPRDCRHHRPWRRSEKRTLR